MGTRRSDARMGIRGRLFLALSAVVGTTIIATFVAWTSMNRLSDTLAEIVGRNMPSVTLSARLAERGGAIIGLAPALVSAREMTERDRVWQDLSAQLSDMQSLMDAMNGVGASRVVPEPRKDIIERLHNAFTHLDEAVEQRLLLETKKEEWVERLRWASADFIDEVEPMIDDIRFNIEQLRHRESTEDVRDTALNRELHRQSALYNIKSDGSVLAELIGRAANLPTLDTLYATEFFFRQVERRIQQSYQIIQSMSGSISLRQSLRDIQSFAGGDSDMFALRAQELNIVRVEQESVQSIQMLLTELHDFISEQVKRQNSEAIKALDRSTTALSTDRGVLIVTVAVALAGAILIVWLYAGNGLVGRIRKLDESMRKIADGDLKADVPVSGADEIADMANSLTTFRDTLLETQAELVQAAKLASMGQLTAGVAHEVNQPLSAIRHYARNAGVLIENGRIEDAAQNLEKINDMVEKINRIIAGLRSLARRPLQGVRRIDLFDVVDEALVLMEPRLRERQIELNVDLPEACRFVMGGKVRLEQVLINIIGNATDAMAESERRVLSIRAQHEGEWISLMVSDTGSGMDAARQEKIFDPFFTTKEIGEGLGLGLSVSYNIIKDLNGTIRVYSDGRTGSTFTVRLRAADGNAA